MTEHASENVRTWSCNACPWTHTAHPIYGWSERNDRAVEVHQTMLCPDARTADDHACIGDDCPGCAVALARHIPPEAVEGVGTGAGEGAPRQDTGSAWVTRSTDCPEAPAQAHPLDTLAPSDD